VLIVCKWYSSEIHGERAYLKVPDQLFLVALLVDLGVLLREVTVEKERETHTQMEDVRRPLFPSYCVLPVGALAGGLAATHGEQRKGIGAIMSFCWVLGADVSTKATSPPFTTT